VAGAARVRAAPGDIRCRRIPAGDSRPHDRHRVGHAARSGQQQPDDLGAQRRLLRGEGQQYRRLDHRRLATDTTPLASWLRLRGQLSAKQANDAAGDSTLVERATLAGIRLTGDVTRRLDLGIAGRLLGSGTFGAGWFGLGAEAGVRPMTGARLAVGYNLFGVVDRDLARPSVTRRGVYVDVTLTGSERFFGQQED
jgi:hypothetical protein